MTTQPQPIALGCSQSVELLHSFLEQIKHFDLSECVSIGQPRASGGYADVYEGTLQLKGYSKVTKVAVKKFRVFIHVDAGKDLAKSILREIRMWANLVHVNVLPFLGYKIVDGCPSLISQWMDNGNLKTYMLDHPSMDIMEVVKGIADGLAYLHGLGVIHADLRCDNILVHADERPLLTDFGISRLLIESKTLTGTNSLKGNVRWMSIELLDWRVHATIPQHQFHTKASDVWAFGMVVYELVAKRVPYFALTQEVVVMLAIIMGERPTDLNGAEWNKHVETLWGICERCWRKNPSERPTIAELSDELGSAVMPLQVTPLRTFFAHRDWIISATFSPDGRYFATASADMTVCVWDSSTVLQEASPGCHKQFEHPNWVYSVAWSPSGQFILTGAQDNNVRLWNVSSGEVLQPNTTHSAGVWSVAFSPDGRLFASGGADNALVVWESKDGSVLFGPVIGHSNWISAVSFSPNSRNIVSCSSDSSVCIWALDAGGLSLFKRYFAHSDWVTSVSFHPTGDYFVTGSKDCTVRIWDVRTGAGVLSKDGFYVHQREVKSVRYSPNGQFILTASNDCSMRIIDAADGSFLTKRLVGHVDAIWCAVFSPNGQLVASAGKNGEVIIWRVIKGGTQK